MNRNYTPTNQNSETWKSPVNSSLCPYRLVSLTKDWSVSIPMYSSPKVSGCRVPNLEMRPNPGTEYCGTINQYVGEVWQTL